MIRVVRLPSRGDERESSVLTDVAAYLRTGALVVYPTETVYGIGTALGAGQPGIERVRAAKGSAAGRPFLVVVDRVESAFGLWSHVPPVARTLAARFWPGPLTLVGPARTGLPEGLLSRDSPGEATIAVRVPGEEWLRALLSRLGDALISTSANRAGRPAPRAFAAVDLSGLRPDLALDGGDCPGARPSTLVSVVGGTVKLLRPGPVDVTAESAPAS